MLSLVKRKQFVFGELFVLSLVKREQVVFGELFVLSLVTREQFVFVFGSVSVISCEKITVCICVWKCFCCLL